MALQKCHIEIFIFFTVLFVYIYSQTISLFATKTNLYKKYILFFEIKFVWFNYNTHSITCFYINLDYSCFEIIKRKKISFYYLVKTTINLPHINNQYKKMIRKFAKYSPNKSKLSNLNLLIINFHNWFSFEKNINLQK